MKEVDVNVEDQAQRVFNMIGDAVFKNLAMRVLDTFLQTCVGLAARCIQVPII